MVLLDEELLSVSQAAQLLPGRPNVATLWRWISRGCKGVKLEVFRSGGRTFTSRQALERFSARLSGRDADEPATDPMPEAAPEPATGRKRAIDGARAQLAAAGIL